MLLLVIVLVCLMFIPVNSIVLSIDRLSQNQCWQNIQFDINFWISIVFNVRIKHAAEYVLYNCIIQNDKHKPELWKANETRSTNSNYGRIYNIHDWSHII